MSKIFLRTPYNYDRDAASDESALSCPEHTLAQQQFKEEADINTILERFGRTGEVIAPNRLPQFGDFDAINDYHSAMNAIVEAQQTFEQLPAKLRARFSNDPGEFVTFCMDDSNREEAVRLGLVKAVEVPLAPIDNPPEAG